MASDPFIEERNNAQWVNHHKNIERPVSKIVTINNEVPAVASISGLAKTAARIQTVITSALAAGVRLRAVGSHWSFSDIPVVEGGWIIETDRLGYRFRLKETDLHPAHLDLVDDLILVQAGAKISAVNEALETKQWRRALRTSGASNGQTIGGALGTGIHGSAIGVGGLESQVTGIQLLTATQNLWIERAGEPILSDSLIARMGAVRVADNAKFAAAIVSLGALGVVHAVVLKATGRYRLNSILRHLPFGQVRAALNSLDFRGLGLPATTGELYFFQVIVDPHKLDTAFTTVRYKELCPPDYIPNYDITPKSEPGTDVPRLIGAAIRLFPALRNLAVSKLTATELRERADVEKEWRTPGETYSFTSARGGVASAGFGIPVAQVTNAIAIMQEAFRVHKSAPIIFTCRYAQRSPGMMAFTRFDPTCILEIDGIDTPATQKLIELVAKRFDAAGMPYTNHWGKINHLTKARVRNGFGGAVDQWNATRHLLLPDVAERHAFSSPFIDAVGLNG